MAAFSLKKSVVVVRFDNDRAYLINVMPHGSLSLEIFLEDCIGRINIEYILPDIQNDKFDKILSFNYTATSKFKYFVHFL
ncbi:hypothetical protein QF049_004763 [Paenibacillus sp. W4I10]|nr:hypothetical protein [Paenibacillus sp. W4I10]